MPVGSSGQDQLVSYWPDTTLGQQRAAEVMYFMHGNLDEISAALTTLEKTLTAKDPVEWWEALLSATCRSAIIVLRVVPSTSAAKARASTVAGY